MLGHVVPKTEALNTLNQQPLGILGGSLAITTPNISLRITYLEDLGGVITVVPGVIWEP